MIAMSQVRESILRSVKWSDRARGKRKSTFIINQSLGPFPSAATFNGADRSVPPSSSSQMTSSSYSITTMPSSSSSAPTKSLRGQRILSEESYVSSLSSLIQREFFPNLPRLTAENDYLAALEDFDNGVEGAEGRMRDAEWRLDALDEMENAGKAKGKKRRAKGRNNSVRMTPRMDDDTPVSTRMWDPTPVRTPTTGQWPATPSASGRLDIHDEEDASDAAQADQPNLANHTVASFQKSYTSEDNASFLDLLQSTNDHRKDKYWWAFKQEEDHNKRRKLILDEASKRADEGYARSVMALPSDQRRKLITSGKLQGQIPQRVQELEKIYQWEEQRRRTRNRLLGDGDSASRRLIRAGSEESTSATASAQPSSSRHASLFLNRPRSATPPPPSGLGQLKHSLDPTSEVSLTRDANGSTNDSNSSETPALRPPRPIRTAATSAGTKWSVRNALFYGPDANISTTDKATSSLPEASALDPDERLPFPPSHARDSSQSIQQRTMFHNTALPSQGLFPESRYPMPYHSGSGGTKRVRSSSSSTSASTARSSRIASALNGGSKYGDNFDDEDGHDVRYKGPIVNGYGFVTPQREGEEEELRRLQRRLEKRKSQQTPSSKDRLAAMRAHSTTTSNAASSSSSRAGFAIPATPKRDEIAYSLATSSGSSAKSKTASTHKSRMSAGASAQTPSSLRQSLGLSPRRHTSTSKRAEYLSPAAQTLLNRSVRGGSNSGSGIVTTPVTMTPARKRKVPPTVDSSSRRHEKSDTMARLKKRGWDDDDGG